MTTRQITDPGFDVIASYESYPEAEYAVDYLSDRGFPVEQAVIVGRGLSSREQITGRATYGRAAAAAAVTGAIVGAILGWILGIFSVVDPLVSGFYLALWGALLGAAVGAVIGLITHAMTRGRRDFSSVSGVAADRYDVEVEPGSAVQAQDLLREPNGPGIGYAVVRPG